MTITIDCESKVKITNKKSGLQYASEEQAQEDINDPSTSTTEEDIQRDVTIIVPKMDLFGETNE
jgi:hypothetical protein|tara:strand:- start:2546 stop:2737 length:192 start_codon:yes stop_codon:yes gene_type:complete